jgi:hypothetical protein
LTDQVQFLRQLLISGFRGDFEQHFGEAEDVAEAIVKIVPGAADAER